MKKTTHKPTSKKDAAPMVLAAAFIGAIIIIGGIFIILNQTSRVQETYYQDLAPSNDEALKPIQNSQELKTVSDELNKVPVDALDSGLNQISLDN
jgi:hypothetical protein